MSISANHGRALKMLILANTFWALSFPTMKALEFLHRDLLPERDTLFTASSTLAIRFGLALCIMLAFCARTIRQITRLEILEGIGLGLFGGVGLLFQMDGLAHTSASTSAFLTSLYCLLIPLFLACQQRRLPPATVLLSCALVTAGVALLSGISWRNLRPGRGEIETLICSVIFVGQILWLQRPIFAGNRVDHFSVVMFAVIALLCLPVTLLSKATAGHWIAGYQSWPVLACLALLVVFSTLGAYLLMNRWQPFLSATEAGLIYCLEPVFASLLALFLPGWFSAAFGINYDNERLTGRLLLGGMLITLANVLIQLRTTRPAPTSAAAA